jgi:hypothetical protein
VAAHLRGGATYGASLCWPDPLRPDRRLCRALAWDSDTGLEMLVAGAAALNDAGLRPLVVRNPAKAGRGHLWLFFDTPVEPVDALARCHRLAPELATIPEHFPNDDANGGRLRLPGGRYRPQRGPAVPVLLAAGRSDLPLFWLGGTTPLAWALLGAAVSRAAVLRATWLPPAERPPSRPWAPTRAAVRSVRPVAADGAFVERLRAWSDANPIESLVQVRHRKFLASWRGEDTASVHLYPDNHWFDFGGDRRHGRDSFDLWCCLNGYWDAATNRPRRVDAARALGLLPAGVMP